MSTDLPQGFVINLAHIPDQLRVYRESLDDLNRRVIALERFKCHCKQRETLEGLEQRILSAHSELETLKKEMVFEQ